MGIQSQGIQIFCSWYHESSNTVFLSFLCSMWFSSTPSSSFPWPFWALPLVMFASPVPPSPRHLPLSSLTSLSGLPAQPAAVSAALSSQLPVSRSGALSTALLVGKELPGRRFIARGCQATSAPRSTLKTTTQSHPHCQIITMFMNILMFITNTGWAGVDISLHSVSGGPGEWCDRCLFKEFTEWRWMELVRGAPKWVC